MKTCRKAILFDLDDTLLDSRSAQRSGLNRLLARCPQVAPEDASNAWVTADEEYHPQFLAGKLTYRQSQAARIRSWAEQLSIFVKRGSELTWFNDYMLGCEASWTAFDDVTPCLEALNETRLGIITDGDGTLQRAKLAALGLSARFEVIIISDDVGWAKPRPEIFQLAATRLDLPLRECIYVGDDREGDALGALAAGMYGIWLNRDCDALKAADSSVYEIAKLTELRGHLQDLHP